MKATFISLCILAVSSIGVAQPTLTASTNNPVVGNKFYIHDCNTASVSSGASGAGVSWSFPGLVQVFLDSMIYSPCLGTPFCDSFPGSTLSAYLDSEYDYYVADAIQFSNTGTGITGGSSVYYPDPQALVKYPMTYGTAIADTFVSIQPAYSYYSRGIDSIISDAWGTLVIPSGTYTNTLRVHYITYQTDSDMAAGMVIDSFRSESYIWFTPGFHSPLLVISLDTFGGGTPLVSNVEYYTTTMTMPSAVAQVNNEADILVYPNPARDVVHIVLPGKDDAIVTVNDLAGRAVAEPIHVSVGTGSIDYNTSTLAAGMYMLRIQSGCESMVKKVTITK